MRCALGWTQQKLADALDLSIYTIENLERGDVLKPRIEVIRKLKNMEKAYEDVLKQYKKAPVRFNRLHRRRGGVLLLPIKFRRPKDLEKMEDLGANHTDMFFGKNSRARVRETGLSLQQKAYRRKVREAITRGVREANARRRDQLGSDGQVQSGQPDGGGDRKK